MVVAYTYKDSSREVGVILLRKEVIHPQIPLRIPCYDLAFLTDPTLVPGYPDASGVTDSANLTGGFR